MAIKDYKFVSPGVQIKEIDQSVLEPAPMQIGPVVIGKFAKGPAFTPTVIDSIDSFRDVFGGTITGKDNITDVWRQGNMKLAPSYASIAAEAHLDAAVSPITIVRMLGEENNEPTTEEGKAGWKVGDPTSNVSTNSGVYALILNKISASDTGFTSFDSSSYVAAMFYVTGGAIKLAGNKLSGSDDTEGTSVWIKSDASKASFSAKVYDKLGSVSSIDFDLNPTSNKFIRKVFNTNPTLINSDATSNTTNYWLGESFEDFISENIGVGDVGSNYRVAAALVPLQTVGNVNPKNFKFTSQPSKSGWIFSQHLGPSGSFPVNAKDYLSSENNKVEAQTKKLFRFVSISKGEYEQENYKILVNNIKPPKPLTKYGSFDISIAKINSKDSELEVVEEFTNVNLDKSSENYIARRIGDKYLEWDYSEERFREYGEYDNNSSIIRIEMSKGIDNGEYGENLLPFGFFGPPRPGKIEVKPQSSIAAPSSTYIDKTTTYYGRPVSGGPNDNGLIIYNYTGSNTTSSIIFPSMPLVYTISKKKSDSNSAYFGINKTTKEKTSVPNDLFQNDLLRPLGQSDFYEPSGSFEYSFVFTLDDVVTSDAALTASWNYGNRANGYSYTANNSSILPVGTDALSSKLEINRFAVNLFGGFDGIDITQVEPFRNTLMEGDEVNEKTSYVYNSYKVALESVADSEVVNMNLLTVPGLTKPSLTQYMIEICQKRGDAMAVIDLEGDFVPAHENTSTYENERPTSSKNAIKSLKDRNINSSYAAAYFPWVKMSVTAPQKPSKDVWVPPSVVAIGTYASSEAKTQLWFAPAGFNRGGLKEVDSRGKFTAGFKVLDVGLKLTSKERDDLYEANINPIANFVNEGIVVFGQKTLQIIPSALDRINVRRLLIYLKKRVSIIASSILFDANVEVTWARFNSAASGFLKEVKSGLGLEDFKVVLDKTTTTPDLVDRNILYAKIYLKPTRAIEYIAVDFIITKSGASFTD